MLPTVLPGSKLNFQVANLLLATVNFEPWVNQYCAVFRQKLTNVLLESAMGENDRRKYFIIKIHERMLTTSAGIEPATSVKTNFNNINKNLKCVPVITSVPVFLCTQITRLCFRTEIRKNWYIPVYLLSFRHLLERCFLLGVLIQMKIFCSG